MSRVHFDAFYTFLGSILDLCCSKGFSLVAVHGLLIAVASLVAELRLLACRFQQLQHAGSAAVAHGLSCFTACGIFLDQGWNPSPLRW